MAKSRLRTPPVSRPYSKVTFSNRISPLARGRATAFGLSVISCGTESVEAPSSTIPTFENTPRADHATQPLIWVARRIKAAAAPRSPMLALPICQSQTAIPITNKAPNAFRKASPRRMVTAMRPKTSADSRNSFKPSRAKASSRPACANSLTVAILVKLSTKRPLTAARFSARILEATRIRGKHQATQEA